jgi:hypothetical protein
MLAGSYEALMYKLDKATSDQESHVRENTENLFFLGLPGKSL